jgi:hypothetical protein
VIDRPRPINQQIYFSRLIQAALDTDGYRLSDVFNRLASIHLVFSLHSALQWSCQGYHRLVARRRMGRSLPRKTFRDPRWSRILFHQVTASFPFRPVVGSGSLQQFLTVESLEQVHSSDLVKRRTERGVSSMLSK